ncbi:hypothetical protein BN946_scf184977.g158 [Trametes cinnabarina]|uniref:Uncharacterized protein n=1 Tax=Pycnoporus cinnabarinus TaxID=5643 RepID=A0A060SD69_PYCCI|nr:hypothetical protein BN946_scf184977.g158 [Trametes cinnabarina]
MVEDATCQLLEALAHTPQASEPTRTPFPAVPSSINWALFDINKERVEELPFEQDVTRMVTQALLERFDSNDKAEEHLSNDVDEEPPAAELGIYVDDRVGGPSIRKHNRPQDDKQCRKHWFP